MGVEQHHLKDETKWKRREYRTLVDSIESESSALP